MCFLTLLLKCIVDIINSLLVVIMLICVLIHCQEEVMCCSSIRNQSTRCTEAVAVAPVTS